MQIEERWVNPAVFPGYLDADFTRTTTFRYLSRVRPTEMEHVIAAVLPTDLEQSLLMTDAAEPCLVRPRIACPQSSDLPRQPLQHRKQVQRFAGLMRCRSRRPTWMSCLPT